MESFASDPCNAFGFHLQVREATSARPRAGHKPAKPKSGSRRTASRTPARLRELSSDSSSHSAGSAQRTKALPPRSPACLSQHPSFELLSILRSEQIEWRTRQH